ncbi:hypothetical protein Tco_1410192 [Tanacetum coccineum]
MKRVNTFVDYRTELVEESSKKAKTKQEESSKKAEAEIAQESSLKRAGEELEQESSKKQKLKIMYGRNQQGLVKVLNWKLYDSCGVHCVTMQNMLFYLLVEKMYPLTNHTLHQMFNDVKLQVDY